MTDALLDVEDVAHLLKVPERTAYKYMAQMVRVVTGRHVRVSRLALEAWVRARTCAPIRVRSSTIAVQRARGGATGKTIVGLPRPETLQRLSSGLLLDTRRPVQPRRKGA
jgi:hypothetical protein